MTTGTTGQTETETEIRESRDQWRETARYFEQQLKLARAASDAAKQADEDAREALAQAESAVSACEERVAMMTAEHETMKRRAESAEAQVRLQDKGFERAHETMNRAVAEEPFNVTAERDSLRARVAELERSLAEEKRIFGQAMCEVNEALHEAGIPDRERVEVGDPPRYLSHRQRIEMITRVARDAENERCVRIAYQYGCSAAATAIRAGKEVG